MARRSGLSVAYAPAPERRWEVAPTITRVYPACGHKRAMGLESAESVFAETGPDDQRIWCPSCRRKAATLAEEK